MSKCVHNESKGGKSRLYRTFENMFARCYRKNNKSYKYCGAKGIRICNEWLNDKSLFFEWAYNNGYNETLFIDRIDNSKDYTPQNCRWASRKIQDRNRTCNQTITYQNQTLCYADWERKLGYRKGLLSQRIKYLKWDKIKALTTPPNKKRSKNNG